MMDTQALRQEELYLTSSSTQPKRVDGILLALICILGIYGLIAVASSSFFLSDSAVTVTVFESLGAIFT